ncbi:MAG: hypothetical protein HY814_12300 [Candidatus Riflebacteria bacterium]|nr:hypothetical protein [Candidatus Riflebacteria bacterium]
MSGSRVTPWILREDRRYGDGHTWVVPAGDHVVRVGIDSLAGYLIDALRAVFGPQCGQTVACGDWLCVLDTPLGNLMIRTPCPGQVRCGNPALARDPGLLLSSPYDEGWLAELDCSSVEGADPFAALVPVDVARDRVRHDLQRFRRQVAMHLLTDADEVGPTLADGGERFTALPQMLGAQRYLSLVQDLLL